MKPRYARWLVIAAAALAVLAAAVFRGDPEADAESPELVLRYVYSTDADDLLEPLIEQYNRETHRSGGREVRVDGYAVPSGEAEAALEAKRDRATALWTPASSIWGELLNDEVGEVWVAPGSPNLVFSPQVIAIWKRYAAALGYPEKPIRWEDIVALATSEDGWVDYGYPKYGRFLLGHTNPGYSTSGLSAVASHYHAVTGKKSVLTLADVQRPDVRDKVRRIERRIVHYGETASSLITKMLKYGRPYAHAVYVQETTLRRLKPQQQAQLVWTEPADGTFVADYPLYVLAGAPWVSAETAAAAETFRRWLRPRITAKNAAENEFEIHRPKRLAELQPPRPDVLAAIQDAWHDDRKPANIVLVVDTSDSMDEDRRLEAAQQGLLSFLRKLSAEDRVELVTSEATQTNVPLGVLGPRREAVFHEVNALVAIGERPVYAAVSRALESLRILDDPDRINAVVVLSDGAGSTNAGLEELLGAIEDQPVTEGTPVRIFTVAYGGHADVDALKKIAAESDGVFFPAGPGNIEDVYGTIFSYF